EARLQEQLLRERVTHLYPGPLRFTLGGEVFGGEGGSVDSVTSGAGPNDEDRISDALGLRPNQLLLLHDADAHRIHERVPLVCRIDDHLTDHRWNTDAVAVVPDALHASAEQVAHPGRVQRAEAERVQHRDGSRAHREHVPKDATHTGRRALVRL